MAGGIQRIAESSSTVSDTMARTAQETKRGNEAVQKAVGQMRSIHQSVKTTSSNRLLLVSIPSRLTRL
ncbi:hypothetical protein P7H15_19790 [Paenibacillus larvae]|nr:hypothetical protein [Paenibacillus larvae]MDT2294598.1 hypothetical protein [Paenibacillus larvae]